MIEADVELSVLLRHFVEEACPLVNARYRALGFSTKRTEIDQFVTVGLTDDGSSLAHDQPDQASGGRSSRTRAAAPRRPRHPPRPLRRPAGSIAVPLAEN